MISNHLDATWPACNKPVTQHFPEACGRKALYSGGKHTEGRRRAHKVAQGSCWCSAPFA